MAQINVEITSGEIIVVQMDRGYSGYSGKSGFSGYSGANPGASGYSGYSGKSGYSGISGKSGYSGASGFSGYSGRSAYSGYSGQGSSGFSGYSGTSGFSGYSGISGFSGYSGKSGYSGTSGFSGYSGVGTILGVIGNDVQIPQAVGTVFTAPYDPTFAILGGAAETTLEWVLPKAGTIRNLYVRTGDNTKTGTPSTVITVRKNKVDTALTLTLTETGNTTSVDTTHSFSVVAGDRVTIGLTNGGDALSTSTGIASITMEMI